MVPSGQNPYYLHSLYSSSQSNAQTLEEQYKKNPAQSLVLQQMQQLQQLQAQQQAQQQGQQQGATPSSASTSNSMTSSGSGPGSSGGSSGATSPTHPMMSAAMSAAAAQYQMGGYPPQPQYPSMMPPQHPMFSGYPAYYQGQPSHPFQTQPIPANPYLQYMNQIGQTPAPTATTTTNPTTAPSQSTISTTSAAPPAISLNITPTSSVSTSSSSVPAVSELSSTSSSTSSSKTVDVAPQQHIRHPNPVEVQTTTASQGALYPIRRRIQKRVICFDSRFRDNYMETSSSDFIYTLPYPIKNVISMRLNSLELPNSWYSYSAAKKTNTFQIIDFSGVSRYITYPDGNYQAMDFDAASKTIIDEAFGTNRLELLVSLTSGKTVIRDVSGRPFQLKFNTGDVNSDIRKNLGWYMGFRRASYSGESEYESEGVYNAGGNDYIYFVLNDYNHSEAPSVVAMMDNSILDDNILAKIPISNDKFQILFDNPGNGVTKQREYMGSVTVSRIHIKILNEFGDRIDFNRMDYSFSLELEIAFE